MITTPTKLSPREIEVIRLAAQGYGNKEIAEKLCVTVGTVGTHVFRVCKVLRLHSRVHLVLYAFKTGLVRVEDIELPVLPVLAEKSEVAQ